MIAHLATAMLAVMALSSVPQPPRWEADYGKALDATRADDQPLLVVLDKPQADDARVDPALLSENSAGSEQVELLDPYQLCHVDVTTEYGQKVAEAFRAKQFPYLAIIDKTGSVIIFSKAGKIDAQEWGQILTSHKDGERPSPGAVSHVTYKKSSDSALIEKSSSSFSNSSYCPSCQRNSF